MAEQKMIPASLVERFAAAMQSFVAEAEQAVAEAAAIPDRAATPALRAWQSKVLPQLQRQERSIADAAALFREGNPEPVVLAAEDKRGLAKDLDGFPLDFAGPAHAQRLDLLETAVVSAAFHLCAAAGIP